MNIAQIIERKDGEILDDVIAIVKQVKEWKDADQNDQFPSSKQSLLLTDSSGMNIWCNIKDHSPYGSDLEGQTVILNSYFDEKRKTWFGFKRNSYTDKKTGKLVVQINGSKTAKISLFEPTALGDGIANVPQQPPITQNQPIMQQPKPMPIKPPEAIKQPITPQNEAIRDAILEAKENQQLTTVKGFAVSYSKDLVVAGKSNIKDMLYMAEMIAGFMLNHIENRNEWHNHFGNGESGDSLGNGVTDAIEPTAEELKDASEIEF